MDIKRYKELAGLYESASKSNTINENMGAHLASMSDAELIDMCDDIFGQDWTRDVCDVEMIRGGLRLKNRDQVIHALQSSHKEATGEDEEMCGEGVGPQIPASKLKSAQETRAVAKRPDLIGVNYGILHADGRKEFFPDLKSRDAAWHELIKAGKSGRRIVESVETNEALGFGDGFATGPRQGAEKAGEQEWRAGAAPKVGGKPGIYNKKTMKKTFYKSPEERDQALKAFGGPAAGLVAINEAHDDDDDGLSAAEKALIAKADTDLAKKGIAVKKFSADEMVGKKKTRLDTDIEDTEKEEKKTKEKSALAALKSHLRGEDKTEKAPAKKAEEPKTKGRKADAGSKSGKARDWLKANKAATRKMFITYATEKLGMSAAHANTAFYALKKKLVEYFVLRHPSMQSFFLAENTMMGQYQWVDPSSDLEVLVFKTEKEAEKVKTYMGEFKNQTAIVEHVSID